MNNIAETVIATTAAPQPVGSYHQGRRIGSLVQVSGQLGLAEGAESVADQTRVALQRVSAVLTAAGTRWDRVLTVRVHLAADDLFEEFDATYGAVVPQPYPARITVASGLAPGALVEIDALAVVGE